jgi:hypothetical protein
MAAGSSPSRKHWIALTRNASDDSAGCLSRSSRGTVVYGSVSVPESARQSNAPSDRILQLVVGRLPESTNFGDQRWRVKNATRICRAHATNTNRLRRLGSCERKIVDFRSRICVPQNDSRALARGDSALVDGDHPKRHRFFLLFLQFRSPIGNKIEWCRRFVTQD